MNFRVEQHKQEIIKKGGENMSEAKNRLGIEILMPTNMTKESEPNILRLRFNLRVGKFLFPRIDAEQKGGQPIKVGYPWEKPGVRIPSKEDRDAIQAEVVNKLQEVFATLSESTDDESAAETEVTAPVKVS